MVAVNRPMKTAEIVARAISDDILRNSRQSGDRLPPEKDMLEMYAVGRGTLREALRYLELQGIIDIKPGSRGGPVVSAPDPGSLPAR